MLVEFSHKYSLEEFSNLALEGNLQLSNHWTDEKTRFAVVYLTGLRETGQRLTD